MYTPEQFLSNVFLVDRHFARQLCKLALVEGKGLANVRSAKYQGKTGISAQRMPETHGAERTTIKNVPPLNEGKCEPQNSRDAGPLPSVFYSFLFLLILDERPKPFAKLWIAIQFLNYAVELIYGKTGAFYCLSHIATGFLFQCVFFSLCFQTF